MVIGVTFLNRGPLYQRVINLHLFSSYWEAWNSFGVWNWQFIILNIIMFVPLGILLPLLHNNFHRFIWTIGAGFLFTLSIESLQLVTGRGSFVLDDMFNNILGVLIGYGLVMGVLTLQNGANKKYFKALGYLSPLLFVTMIFTAIFVSYSLQEFGNLAVAPSYRINMKDTQVTLNIELEEERKLHPVYQAPAYTGDSAADFAVEYFENLHIDTSSLEIDAYSDSAIYRTGSDPSYSLSFNYVGGSYSFTEFSSFDVYPVDVDEDILIDRLEQFGVRIPEGAEFNKKDIGRYRWIVEKNISGNQLKDGFLSCVYFSDGTIKQIRNELVVYNKVKNVPLKSEREAYEELLEGRFKYWYPGGNIETVDIHEIELGYQLDSKGFYQPVYLFKTVVNGAESSIIIPAMVK